MNCCTDSKTARRLGALLASGLLICVLALAGSGCQRAQARGKLQIFFSGNIRGNVAPCGCHVSKGGIARLAAFLQRQGDPEAAWLTVDAGNYVDRDGNGGCSGKCQFMVTSYKDLHYDVLNLGQQEVWMGHDVIQALIDTTKNTEFVSANLLDKKTRKPLAKPTVIRDYGHMRVGLIGLLNETEFPPGTTLLDSTKLEVTPYLEAARNYLPGLIRKSDAVVVLCGLASAQIDTLVRLYPEIDLVLSYGALQQGENVQQIGKTRVLGTGQSGYNGHWAMLNFGTGKADSLGFASYMDPLIDSYEEAGPWADRLAAFKAAPQPAPRKG